jgi:hypothetical protein
MPRAKPPLFLQGNIVPERIVSALSLGDGPVGLRLHGVDKVGKLQADTVRDIRGFATKFYTDEGIFDLVGNNTPVFFIQSQNVS